MTKRQSQRKRKLQRRDRHSEAPKENDSATGETRTADVATVAWTVSSTTVLMCDVGAALALGFARWRPEARGMHVLGELLLFAGAATGALSLLLLVFAHRLRRVAPPTGLSVFAACAAAAPILAVVVRALR